MISAGMNDAQISERLNQILKKLKIEKDPLIISLPRPSATLRYLKIPSHHPKEIERIANLQASRFLPYPVGELITGYSFIRTDKEGYAHINLIIVHQDVIKRLVHKIFKDRATQVEAIVLISYGLCRGYTQTRPRAQEPLMLIDIDSCYTEIAIILEDKILFSRAFKLSPQENNFTSRLIEEVGKTREASAK